MYYLSFPIMSDEIAPSVSMVSRDLYVRFITEVFSLAVSNRPKEAVSLKRPNGKSRAHYFGT